MKQTWTQFTLALLSVLPALAQSNKGRIAFEAAIVKVNKSGGSAPEKERILPGGRIEQSNATLKELIAPIYGVKANMIIGRPKRIDSTGFDIVAKAAPDSPVPALLKMVQALLEDQFKLTDKVTVV